MKRTEALGQGISVQITLWRIFCLQMSALLPLLSSSWILLNKTNITNTFLMLFLLQKKLDLEMLLLELVSIQGNGKVQCLKYVMP